MEVGVLGDHAAILMEMAASRADDDIEIVDCVEVFVGERFVDERPEVLGWLLCVPRTSSVLISRRNRLTSAHYDRAAMFGTGRLDRAIQVEEPA